MQTLSACTASKGTLFNRAHNSGHTHLPNALEQFAVYYKESRWWWYLLNSFPLAFEADIFCRALQTLWACNHVTSHRYWWITISIFSTSSQFSCLTSFFSFCRFFSIFLPFFVIIFHIFISDLALKFIFLCSSLSTFIIVPQCIFKMLTAHKRTFTRTQHNKWTANKI